MRSRWQLFCLHSSGSELHKPLNQQWTLQQAAVFSKYCSTVSSWGRRNPVQANHNRMKVLPGYSLAIFYTSSFKMWESPWHPGWGPGHCCSQTKQHPTPNDSCLFGNRMRGTSPHNWGIQNLKEVFFRVLACEKKSHIADICCLHTNSVRARRKTTEYNDFHHLPHFITFFRRRFSSPSSFPSALTLPHISYFTRPYLTHLQREHTATRPSPPPAPSHPLHRQHSPAAPWGGAPRPPRTSQPPHGGARPYLGVGVQGVGELAGAVAGRRVAQHGVESLGGGCGGGGGHGPGLAGGGQQQQQPEGQRRHLPPPPPPPSPPRWRDRPAALSRDYPLLPPPPPRAACWEM